MNANVKFTYEDADGNIITEPKEGDIARCRENSKACKYTNGEWKEVQGNLNFSNYQMNQMMIYGLKDLTEEEIAEKQKEVQSFVQGKEDTYYMLLCKDCSYYTVFHLIAEGPKIASEVIECVKELGTIKDIYTVEDGSAIEIWFSDAETAHVAYFFPYQKGVIECTL